MVEEVEEFHPDLRVESLREYHSAPHSEVQLITCEATQRVAAECALAQFGRYKERSNLPWTNHRVVNPLSSANIRVIDVERNAGNKVRTESKCTEPDIPGDDHIYRRSRACGEDGID